VITLDAVARQHGRQILFTGASAAINRGDKVGLVGPNGSGKTTLFRMITKEEAPDAGNVAVPKDVSIGYFRQDVGEMKEQKVVAAAMDGAGPVSEVMAELSELEAALGDPSRMDEMEALVERFGEVQGRFEELDGYSLEARAREILAGLGFSAVMMDQDLSAMSGGWKMRVALTQILLMRPDVLLLDEPTNHLDLESILWLEGFLKRYEGALVMTCHDREFMNRIVSKILEIDGGDIITYTGDYDFFESQRALNEKQAEAQHARQQAMLKKEERFIERFKAQAAKAAQVQSRVKKLEKIERLEPPKRRKKLKFDFRVPPRSGDDVISFEQVSKAYGDNAVLESLDLLVRRKERWCVMGVNGAGKSTLLKLVAGTSEASGGEVRIGASVKMAYFAQHAMEVLDGTQTVFECLTEAFPVASVGSLRTLAGVFGFPGDDADKPVRILSGGEKARVVLARMLYDPPNLLVLDEPTNHLDMDTKEMLVDALEGYEGTMLFVSHDRSFLSKLSNRVLELGGAEGPRMFGGGYLEYIGQTGYEAPGMRP
jgi:ATPase subunit of ABC transporter with duplicated ATPase domains